MLSFDLFKYKTLKQKDPVNAYKNKNMKITEEYFWNHCSALAIFKYSIIEAYNEATFLVTKIISIYWYSTILQK